MQCFIEFDTLANVESLSNGVPKIIMQTWKTTSVPKQWTEGQKSIQEHFPNWTYILMSDAANDRFVERYFPQYLQAFRLLRYPIQRADVIRYMFLYTFGGLYLDLDYQIIRSFEPLIESIKAPLLLLHSGNITWVLTNSLIVARPKLPIFLTLIHECLFAKLPWYYIGKHIQVMFSTGPMRFHDIIVNSGTPYAVLPRKLFMPVDATIKDSSTDITKEINTEHIYTLPLPGGTWNSIDSFLFNFLLQYKKEFLCLFGALILWFARGHLHWKLQAEKLLNTIHKLKSKLRKHYVGTHYESTRGRIMSLHSITPGTGIE
jgi:mannosyltransferase OCH1-like enzyme